MTPHQHQKILIVEDNPNMSSLLADMLEVFAVESVLATDGRDALQKLESEPIAMVISDMRMPRMSGTELLAAVKEKDPKMPVVLISGFTLQASDEREAAALADGFLSKPFKMNDIKNVLEKHFPA